MMQHYSLDDVIFYEHYNKIVTLVIALHYIRLHVAEESENHLLDLNNKPACCERTTLLEPEGCL